MMRCSTFMLCVVFSLSVLFLDHLHADTIVVSMGDNLVVIGAPYDSESTIKGNFEAMKRDWGVTRVWWRGGQDQYFRQHFDRINDDTLTHSLIWDWIDRHDKLASKAVPICKNLGLEVWLWAGLFELGANPDTGGNSQLPYLFEHKLRKKHPEWIPINRYGTRRQDGGFSFCYPKARAAYIKTWKEFLVRGGYHGVVFYTYAENFGTRYLDEFGFNQPIVDEFKKRYGVDIRTDKFDKKAWSQLRGEYFTQFLRELRAALKPHNIKIGIQLDVQNERIDLPMAWPGAWAAPKVKRQRVGRISLNWQTWVDESLVDELNVYYPGSVKIAQKLLDYCRKNNPKVRVSAFMSTGTPPQGALTVFQAGTAVQSGFPVAQVNSPPNTFGNPAKTLKVGNKWQKRKILYLASMKKLKLDIADIATAAEDDDVFVRSMAIRALSASGNSKVTEIIEKRLSDPENSVRCLAAVELGKVAGKESLRKILDAIVPHGGCQYNLFAVSQAVRQMKANGKLGIVQKRLLKKYLKHLNKNVRRAVIYSVGATGFVGECKEELLFMAKNDTDSFCRASAMNTIVQFGIEDSYEILKDAIEGKDQTMQVRAAQALGYYGETRLTGSYQDDALQLLSTLFRKYATARDRSDRAWGWRCVGNALLAMGSNGEAVLKNIMRDKADVKLANLAWRVLYIRQHPQKYLPVTEQQDKAAHQFRRMPPNAGNDILK